VHHRDVDDAQTADPILAEVTRSGFVEAVHRGRVVALDPTGAPVVSIGAVDAPVLPRSTAKPLQAVGMLRAGIELDGADLAIACASHDGTPMHINIVDRVLARAGLGRGALATTPMLPLEAVAHAACLLSTGPTPVHHNCSGQHAAMLATCAANGWPTDGYLAPDHPLQVAILAAVEDLAGEPIAHVAIDGCGAPNMAVSLTALARAFARLATAEPGTPEHRAAQAMRDHPEVVGGEARDVTRLLRAVPGLVAKDGAEGCFAAATADGRAAAVKVDDGAMRATVPVLVAALRALGVDSEGLAVLAETPVLGHGEPVGSIRPVS
jgi:L-asparaginase II